MDEMSSLDSFQTTEGAEDNANAQDDNTMETDTATTTNASKHDGPKEDDEDFDEISDGTFEADDNSQETATKTPTASNPDEAPENTSLESQKSADFEEVDTNVSADATADEADVLGQSDMTLPEGKETKEHGDEGDGDVEEDHEHEADNERDKDNEREEDNDHDEETSLEKTKDCSSMEVDDDGEEASGEGHNVTEESERENDANVQAEEGDESVEDIEEDPKNTTKEQEIATKETDEAAVKDSEDTEKDKDADDDAAAAAADMDVDDDDADHEDEPVENVQEPEESDVCLIPDDTETEMTQAEKEQAILARENAEKEHEEAEKDKQKDKDESFDSSKGDDRESAPASETTYDDEVDEPDKEPSEPGGPDAKKSTSTVHTISDSDEAPTVAGISSTTDEPTEDSTKVIIGWIVSLKARCVQCGEEKTCDFRYTDPDTRDRRFVCQQECCEALMQAAPDKYFMRRKKFLIEELPAAESDKDEAGDTVDCDGAIDHDCMQCKDPRPCKYFFRQDDDVYYLCSDDCFNLLNAIEPDKFQLKRHSIRVRNIGSTAMTTPQKRTSAESRVVARTSAEAELARQERAASFTRRCSECFQEVVLNDKNLMWETMDFCNEQCLGKYQRTLGSSCQTCHGDVPHPALGKYCVRFGFDIRQFCCAACLNEYKKGLKTCSCCQKDISSGTEGFLAPVGDKEQFKDFCSQSCMRRYDAMCNPNKTQRPDDCSVCNNNKPVQVSIMLDDTEHTFCSNPCFSAFKFVSNIVADQCGMCSKYFERKGTESYTIYMDRRTRVFCSRICLNVYIIVNRCIVACQWCKVKKYNFDMIYKPLESQEVVMCSLNCLTLYGVSMNAFSRTIANCDNCHTSATPQYHLTMSDASMRNFCTYQCVMQFQGQFARAPLTLDEANDEQRALQSDSPKGGAPFPTGLPKRVKLKDGYGQLATTSPVCKKIAPKPAPPLANKSVLPVITNVASLASGENSTMIGSVTVRRSRGRGRKIDSPPPTGMPSGGGRGRGRRNLDYSRSPSPPVSASASVSPPPRIGAPTETRIIAVPPYPPTVRNVQTMCQPRTVTTGCQATPATESIGIQTDKDYSNKVLIPVPVPIFIPQPMWMYSAPFPVPVPIPLPIPVPIFIPTTRNSAEGILKEIKKIQDKMPADPFEAELLMMAEMVAEEKNEDDSDSGDEVKPDPSIVNLQYANSVPQQVEVANNSYGEDVLQMAIKMATSDYDQPTVDLESAMQTNTITNPPPHGMVDDSIVHISPHHMQEQQHIIMDAPQRSGRGRKRGSLNTSPVSPRNQRAPLKRARLSEIDEAAAAVQQAGQSQSMLQPNEKPDANMCLKYTFGVNAWKQWVMTKNSDIEKNSLRRRTFKTELLQMTADELNYSLCLFVKEVRKPNGTEYAPDTIYYLVLGIQQYLYENGRIDNIFTDPYYERFTDCLDEVARRFSVLYNDSQYIVTRVEEEHLWECKQLGAHSPHVLLSTLMFFNTKHFNLTTVEEHMQLSFSHIMKHWKRSAQNSKNPGTRNVLLRFYPPQAGLETNPRKKKVYEQQENEENPLRCPVRLYEFYLSKCPESVKTRNDVFYLQPERSCVPDSPVWYSTQALSRDSLEKMLHRVKMVKEINIALLTS